MNPEPQNRQTPPSTPRPTSGKENNKVFIFAVAGAAVVLGIVLAFNLLGPPGPAGEVELTNQKPNTPASSSQSPSPSPGSQTSPAAAGTTVPLRGDTPHAPERQGVGAPAGASTGPAALDAGTPTAPTHSAASGTK
ncbi:MAG: hypothetical protein Q8N13_21415 [Acidovorax sp.]|nr:hypothetical protein [Acidovorax sp.]